MALRFVKRRASLPEAGDRVSSLVPTLDVLFATTNNRLRRATFLVDSGADVSMAPRRLSELLGLNWETGEALSLRGISPKPECLVPARIFKVELLVPDIGVAFNIPICFADGDASRILGREGFFDAFRIRFDKPNSSSEFELVDEPEL
jgi:hypothetical protein